jgi:hypothetical protein
MNWIKIISRINFNELAKLASAAYMIGTSLYDLFEDVSKLRKEHGLLAIGLVILFRTLKDIYVKVNALVSEVRTDIADSEKQRAASASN